MNHNFTLLDELITNFRDLRNQQEGDDLSHILLEYVDPKICVNRFVPYKNRPQNWRDATVLERNRILINTDERIYESLIIPYRGNAKLLSDGDEKSESLPDKFISLRKKLIDNIEMAGNALLRHSISQTLPPEIIRHRRSAQSWLFFLHYSIKPERVTWKPVNRVIELGTAFGVISCPEDSTELPDSIPLDSERHTIVGEFAFNPLSENSYSQIRDIANASIEAIYLIKAGEVPGTSEFSSNAHQEKWISSKQIREIAAKHDAKQEEPFSTTWLSEYKSINNWPEPDKLASGRRPHEWKLSTIKPFLIRDLRNVPSEEWDQI